MTGYGRLKDTVADAVISALEPLRTRHDDLLGDPAELARILDIGADRARATSRPVITAAYRAMGVMR